MAEQLHSRAYFWLPSIASALELIPLRYSSKLLASVLAFSPDGVMKKSTIRKNVQGACPELDRTSAEAMTARIAANCGRHVAEFINIANFKDDSKTACMTIDPTGSAIFNSREPAIYVGAHVGSWELAPLAFHNESRSLTVIYSQNKNPFINKALLSFRQRTGAIYVEKEVALKPCMKALQQGDSIALLVDQRVDEGGILIDFFGRPAKFSRIPAKLAIKYGCPIVPFEVRRLGPERLNLVIGSPIRPVADDIKHTELELTQKMASAIQASIKRNIDTWFCNKRRWKSIKTVSD